MTSIRIGDRRIGPGHLPFIVAEVGINHNGDLERALEMVRVAARSGADAVKFQTFRAAEFVNDPSQMFTYLSQGREVTESMLAMFRRHELPEHAWAQLKTECDKESVVFLSTPQNRSDLDLLLNVGIPAIKVGSDDFTNIPLLKSYSTTNLPMILSCGMSDLAEVYQALDVVGALYGYPAVLLVCTSQYPTPPEDVNLARITTLRATFPTVPIGFSDHSQGPLASSLAVALGACLLEKHFTLDHALPGPDHWFAEDPAGLAAWIGAIRSSYRMLGDPVVRPTRTERTTKPSWQRRLVAARAIAKGERIEESSLTLRRVEGGRGLPPAMLNHLLGRHAPRSFQPGEPIDW